MVSPEKKKRSGRPWPEKSEKEIAASQRRRDRVLASIKRLGLTHMKIAEAVGVSRSMITLWLSGRAESKPTGLAIDAYLKQVRAAKRADRGRTEKQGDICR